MRWVVGQVIAIAVANLSRGEEGLMRYRSKAVVTLAIVATACTSNDVSADVSACRAGADYDRLIAEVGSDIEPDDPRADEVEQAKDEFTAAFQAAEAPELADIGAAIRDDVHLTQIGIAVTDADIAAANQWCKDNGEPEPFPGWPRES